MSAPRPQVDPNPSTPTVDRRVNTWRDDTTWTEGYRRGVMARLNMRNYDFLMECEVKFKWRDRSLDN